jgi:hypothetical protein
VFRLNFLAWKVAKNEGKGAGWHIGKVNEIRRCALAKNIDFLQ